MSDAVATPDVPPVRAVPRWWPGLVIIGLFWSVLTFMNVVYAGTFAQFMTQFMGPLITTALFVMYWLAVSRLSWGRKLCSLLVFAALGGMAAVLADKSMPMGLIMFALPWALTLWFATEWLSHRANSVPYALAVVAPLALCWGYFTLLRVDGIWGGMGADMSWRWAPTAEDRYLAEKSAQRPTRPVESEPGTTELTAGPGDWPGFRGLERDAVVRGVTIDTDWATHPPKLLWKQPIGPGWSSCTVIGPRLFTQEQRGEQEVVVCLDANTGRELWLHADATRFWEVVAGAGPRATPTFAHGRLYTMGANGLLNSLDAATGTKKWQANVAADAGVEKTPEWGFAGSPLVLQGHVLAYAGGKDNCSVLAYAAETGELVWKAGRGTLSYSSPHRMTQGGREYALMLTEYGVQAFEPATGKVAWEHAWDIEHMARIVQPTVLDDGRLLLGTGYGLGSRLIRTATAGEQMTTQQEWQTRDYKPYFNDGVVSGDYLYGFDGDIFCCVSLSDGKRQWKKGRYGYGQVLLLPEQKLLMVLGEKGEVVLVEASPKQLTEVARAHVLEGKTWNPPVVANGKLYVRNAEQIACYELAMTAESTPAKEVATAVATEEPAPERKPDTAAEAE